MFVNSTITSTMITQAIERPSMTSSNFFECVCSGGNSNGRSRSSIRCLALAVSRVVVAPDEPLAWVQRVSRRFSHTTQYTSTATITAMPIQVST